MKTCSIQDCDRPHLTRGYCAARMTESSVTTIVRGAFAAKALAFSAPADTSRRRTAGVRENRVTSTRETQQRFRLSTPPIRTLSERSPSSQGRTGNWAGTVKRTVTPDRFRTGRPCLAAINSLGPLAPGLSALVKYPQKSASVVLKTFQASCVAPAFHEQKQTIGAFPDDGKSTARSGKSTARGRNVSS